MGVNEIVDLSSDRGGSAGLRLATSALVRRRGKVRALFPLALLRAPNSDGPAVSAGADGGAHALPGDEPPPEAA